MKTIDLRKQQLSGDDLVNLASLKPVIITSKHGKRFVLENADDFDAEVEELGRSQKFMKFLHERSKERATISIEEFSRSIGQKKVPKNRV